MSIQLDSITAGYDRFRLQNVTAQIPTGSLTALIGPNGCGKSTLLKTISRQLAPGKGRVHVDNEDISTLRTRAVAQRVSVLPQHPVVPPGITVERLVGYGRAPHQNLFGYQSRDDQQAVELALEMVSLTAMKSEAVSSLSGGQRQRAFLAMCIAQDTPFILLDEPTSFLDIRYQFEVLELMSTLQKAGKTVVAVLHDIAQAARFATHIVVMKDGRIEASGPPDQVVTPDLVKRVYGVQAHVYADPVSGTKVVSPEEKGMQDHPALASIN
ncbi:iron complex transport system ATP-binding protein [Aliiroseovarius halocynthiae]|uniref:ABC transporter ATP-binding protein n=1 Tax=Aliiroseovarius halocynthiae TaxID=985055 RepID=A0A545SQP1_9RHOB|nr:ABC transporter ATP-binding protein [Aliiroseovarius halocynthiae]TQV67196.1 ABC transporter ATP-binding protein [Aliiroseovarius halocynthiae]SMR82072.1 iron complex transport system ATP-binding protein [Aliiroseovarius halocynthiae]